MPRFARRRALRLQPSPQPSRALRRARSFVSLRWRLIAPLALIVLLSAMLSAYLVGNTITAHLAAGQDARVLRAARAVTDRLSAISADQQREALRIAYTAGVADLISAGDAAGLHPILEPLAAAADLDLLLIADPQGREIIGLQRINAGTTGTPEYAVARGTDLAALLDSAPALGGTRTTTYAALVRTGQEHVLLTAAPVQVADQPVGTVLTGIGTVRLLDALQGVDPIGLAIFGAAGEFVRTTLPYDDSTRGALTIPPAIYRQALSTPDQVPVARLTLGGEAYRAAYVPLVAGSTPLGVLGLYLQDEGFAAAVAGRDVLGVLAAALVGAVMVIAFAVAGRASRRLERITATALALARGDARARTGMRPRDEVGEVGAALDHLADRHQQRTDALQTALRQQRRDSARLNAVLEAIPDGIVVQDLDGRVLLINEAARQLLGGQRVFRSARLHELTAVVTEKLGPALAPGIYALGDPTRLPLEGKLLQAQAAAIVLNEVRLGTVIVLRDMTAEVMREQAREALLDRLAQQAIVPTSAVATGSLAALAREFVHNTRAIQRVIADLRDLSTFEPRDLQTGQRPLAVHELLGNIAAEWEPLARASQTRLQVSFGPRGRYVLGDDRRLRWAIGNLIDNALKYSPPQTTITLRARPAPSTSGKIEIVLQDQGYGIAPEDLQRAFTRFFRGTPRDAQGQPVRTPGTGQGLFIARRVIEAHGGSIAIASRVGLGTTVVVRLPLTAPIALELPGTGVASAAGDPAPPAEDFPPLPSGPYDTVPLEPRRFPWERKHE